MQTLDDTADWMRTLINTMDRILITEETPEVRAGMTDAIEWLSLHAVATITAYKVAGGDLLIGRGYNLVNRMASAAQTASSAVTLIAMHERVGADWERGYGAVMRHFRNACENWIVENL